MMQYRKFGGRFCFKKSGREDSRDEANDDSDGEGKKREEENVWGSVVGMMREMIYYIQ